MNRREAIQHVFELTSLSAGFCCGTGEPRRAENEVKEALRALGVSEAEIVEART